MNLTLREIVYEIHGTVQASGNRSVLDEKPEIAVCAIHHAESEVHFR